jgi:hypothetical protein
VSDNGLGEISGARRRRLATPEVPPQDVAPSVTADAVDSVGGEKPKRRRNRKPFGNKDQKLAYPDRPGYHRHWFNDVPGRLIQADEAGYSQVKAPDGKPVSMVVGIGRGGQPLTAYLHEIPQEDYDEDMAAQDSEVHERLGQIERGQLNRPGGRDGQLQYAGSERGDISIRSGNRR